MIEGIVNANCEGLFQPYRSNAGGKGMRLEEIRARKGKNPYR